MSMSGWKQVFADANTRCDAQGVQLRATPHMMLRHSYAVITLELPWRGHVQALGEMNEQERLTYQRVFGDPLNCSTSPSVPCAVPPPAPPRHLSSPTASPWPAATPPSPPPTDRPWPTTSPTWTTPRRRRPPRPYVPLRSLCPATASKDNAARQPRPLPFECGQAAKEASSSLYCLAAMFRSWSERPKAVPYSLTIGWMSNWHSRRVACQLLRRASRVVLFAPSGV